MYGTNTHTHTHCHTFEKDNSWSQLDLQWGWLVIWFNMGSMCKYL